MLKMKMMNKVEFILIFITTITLTSCSTSGKSPVKKPELIHEPYVPKATDRIINREKYTDKLHGFWLGTCIANWTGLVTEMDKIGNVGEIKTGDFYTRENWGNLDEPSIWGEGKPSDISKTIDFVLIDSIWGADDDTDIEYIYQELLLKHKTALLSGEQIREGWDGAH